MGLLQVQVEKTVNGVETHWLSGKENVPGPAVSKEGDVDNVLGCERTHDYWFTWKRSTCKECFQFPTP